MASDSLRRLVALEARRAWPTVAHTTLLGAAALVVLAVAGWLTRGRVAFLLMVWSLAGPWSLPMNVLRDRLDGGLEFLQSLPVSASLLAGARLLAVVVFAVPAGVAASIALWTARPDDLLVGAVLPATLGVFLGATTGVSVIGALGVGIALRLEARSFGNVVAAGFVALIAGHEVTRRYFPTLVSDTLAVLSRPGVPRILGVAAPLVVAALGWIAFRLARSGVERFTPGRDRVTW